MDDAKLMFKCGTCGWTGTGEQAMQPDPEVREDWEKVWKFRKGLKDEFGTQFYLGTVKWEDELSDDLVCPKCAGEASLVEEE
jgi:rubredoxin